MLNLVSINAFFLQSHQMLCSSLTFMHLLRLCFSLIYCSILVLSDFVRLPATWKNVRDGDNVYHFKGNHTVMLMLYEARHEQVLFGCGFHCAKIDCENGSYTFSIFVASNPTIGMLYISKLVEPRVVWSGNRDRPVGINSTLELTSEGDLVLKDADGTVAWSTRTSGKSVAAMNLTDGGNLMLLDGNNETVWKSFDYPTDTLLLGQALKVGQKLIHRASWTNQTEGGLFSLSLTIEGLFASVESNSSLPQAYYSTNFIGRRSSSFVRIANGSLDFSVEDNSTTPVMNLPYASAAQYVNLGSDGHLRLYDYRELNGEVELADLLGLDPCRYPTVCGNYGVCSQRNCKCPMSSGRNDYFEQRDAENPNRGCSMRSPLTCKASESKTFLEIPNIDYFNFVAHLEDVDLESCKDACSKNCSCRAVFYRVSPDNSKKWCFLPSEVLSIINGTNSSSFADNHTDAYIKVHSDLSESPWSAFPANDHWSNVRRVLVSIFAATISASILITILALLLKKKKIARNESTEAFMEVIPGLPKKFTYADLQEITKNFTEKLGDGGFGNVYEGTLRDGTKVAVKHIDGFENSSKYFFAEVKSIGSIHHANLVRLLGYCSEDSHRLLVYEHLSNGSLDKWIFADSEQRSLPNWNKRRNIILDVAKGLRYLHEECAQKIVHCDIKPQNILLDESFRAKVSDFGLSKPIDREEIQVMTAMRGTPGYLAPEWLSGAITEKVDVYSFGMVILDILCGREASGLKLLEILKRGSEDGSLSDVIDQMIEDADEVSARRLVRVSAWCLQADFRKRPSMSTVIKVLEGASNIQGDIELPSSPGIILDTNASGT